MATTFFGEVFRIPSCPQWATPNTVVHTGSVANLRHFGGAGPTLLILPPQAGQSSCIADFAPQQSLVRTALSCGHTVYAVDWKTGSSSTSISDLVVAVQRCLVSVDGPVTLVGLCQGGWLAAIYAALFPQAVRHLILAAAPVDFHAGSGPVKQLALSLPLSYFQWLVLLGGGYMPGEFMCWGFKWLHPYERFVGRYLDLADDYTDPAKLERYRRFWDWYEWPQAIAGTWYLEAVGKLFQQNKLIRGDLQVLGRDVWLQSYAGSVDLIGGTTDDLTPPEQVFRAADFLGGMCKKHLVDAGHIGVFTKRQVLEETWSDCLSLAGVLPSAVPAA